MTTREIIQSYFDRLGQKNRWEESLADDLTFTSFTSPIREVKGKDTYLKATKGLLLDDHKRRCARLAHRRRQGHGTDALQAAPAERRTTF